MIDLKDLMDERSAHGTPGHGRLAEVQHKIRLRQRRRALAGTAAAAAVLALAAASTLVLGAEPAQPPTLGPGSAAASAGQPTITTSATPKPVAGRKLGPFAEYARGYRVMAAGEAPVSSKKVQLTWTVNSTDVQFFSYCPGLPNKYISLDAEVAINGESTGSMNCLSEVHQGPMTPGSRRVGANIGETVTVTYTVTAAQDMKGTGRQLATIPTEGILHFAVAEKVPFDEYPLPPRPTKLKLPKPDGMGTEPGTRIVHSDPTDANKAVSISMPWHRGYDFTVIPQTPGIYQVSVNGISVLAGEVYDYSGNGPNASCQVKRNDQGFCVPELQSVKDGDHVTITVTAQHATGPWLAELRSEWQDSAAQG
ncbi:hypothetical protein Vqi01_28910 [Micromonospora qiuiae]|uniref:Uncharacterized protein n=1 Tax=Micromonospora qiuiae TaxID=502268 RepID=A0ABQ4JC31_9ACTN|nr:hypothetical protein [Micromonospora qiuiae]GIJ27729.1 hypothetical protein Vqi01_28910 [Micromonospora qiuiae]